MNLFRTFHKLLPLAMTAALSIGGNATKSWAAPKTSEEKPVPAKTAKLVDINTATAAELENVPGIGPSYAKRIIANRPYLTVNELSKTGIPAARLEKILPLVTVQEKVTAKERPAVRSKPAAAGEKTASTSGKADALSKTQKPTALVDINTATAEQLEAIAGIGPAYAKRIIAARPYASTNDLSKAGIPASRLGNILPLVTVTQLSAVTQRPAEKAKPAGGSSTTDPTSAKTVRPADATSVEARTPPRKGMVWANSESKIYHVEGDRWYGKTKKGEWMTEEDAVKAGYRKSK